MSDDKVHVIHSRGGRIGGAGCTSPAEVDAIVEALRADGRGHLVLHFHGGLVNQHAGMDIAKKLAPRWREGGLPVFFVWESGAWETIRNNLGELAGEPVFRELLRKLMEYALEQLGAVFPGIGARSVARSVMPGSVNAAEVKATFDRFWANPGPATVPYRDVRPQIDRAGASRSAARIDEDAIQADLEQDPALLRALATLPGLPAASRSRFAPQGAAESASTASESAFANHAADVLSARPGTRGLVELYVVARFLAGALRRVIGRCASGRDHGLYATVLEELVRGFKVGGSSASEWARALQWSRMKQDTADAFGPDVDGHAGTALLLRLKQALASGLALQRITLVAHSAGSLYAAHWLMKSRLWLPSALRHDLLLLAPAITVRGFDALLQAEGSRISGCRMFALDDAHERSDQVWGDDDALPPSAGTRDFRRFVYPSSLLYLVSGILESTRDGDGNEAEAPDEPLLGMQRFHVDNGTYPDTEFEAIAHVRRWFDARADSRVWSPSSSTTAGLTTGCIDHGGFDDDEGVRDSVVHLLKSGL